MRQSLLFALAVGIAVALASSIGTARGDHIYPPLLPSLCAGQDVSTCPTPHIVKARENRVVTYRLDQGTLAYPGFRQQAADVAAAWYASVGVEGREITEGIPDLWLTFPSDSAFLDVCGDGAAACIQYWADPVMVYFRRSLLYGDWKTAITHEGINGGHALGLHERYDDRNFRCISNPQPPTVMSCGSGIWQPQPFDIEWTCIVLGGCFPVQEPPPCFSNDLYTWCWYPEDDAQGLAGWHIVVDVGVGPAQQWRNFGDGSPWFCVDHCPAIRSSP